MATNPATPIQPRKRIDIADVLRGIAVMGIIVLHSIEHFNFYSFPSTEGQSAFLNFTDKAIWNGMFFTFGGKAYAIFALLFGFSFFIQDDNQRIRGNDFRLRFAWRLVLLFLIGNINAMFFTGEVLVLYSLVGFILILTCRLPNKIAFIFAILFLLQPVEWGKIIYSYINPDYVPAADLAGIYFGKAFEVQMHGNFLETVKMNLWEGQIASLTWAWEHGRMFQTAGLFILGMLIGRWKLFLRSDKNLKIWLSVLGISLICFFPLFGIQPMLSEFISNPVAANSLSLIIQSLANFSFMLILVSGIILGFYSFKPIENLFRKIIPYGKMSLTNYLTQSIIGATLFYNWGFGLHQYLGITYSFLVGIGLFILQLLFCRWWMKHHTHGPFEYLWKKATWIGRKTTIEKR